jgi:hypothetical protein
MAIKRKTSMIHQRIQSFSPPLAGVNYHRNFLCTISKLLQVAEGKPSLLETLSNMLLKQVYCVFLFYFRTYLTKKSI